ncbi:type II toxin-antitoxin system RelE/ParE family toxin [Calycomorphotria hydatis]|nr:type II toxin-antitoxin system RelE/ParE family toxin [Calycomorphotria hydatis]
MYRIRVMPKARRQIEQITQWYHEQASSDVAETWYSGLVDSLDALTERPDRFDLAREDDAVPFELRAMLYGSGKKRNYRVLYTIQDTEVVVLAVRHVARRDLTIDDLQDA